jgi:hypothetical protein
VPETAIPIAKPVTDDTAVSTLLPLVVVAVGVTVAPSVVFTSRPGETPASDGVPL